MRNPLPDFVLTLVVLTAIFIAVHSYNMSLRNDTDYFENVDNCPQMYARENGALLAYSNSTLIINGQYRNQLEPRELYPFYKNVQKRDKIPFTHEAAVARTGSSQSLLHAETGVLEKLQDLNRFIEFHEPLPPRKPH